jgi:hypothetical protein
LRESRPVADENIGRMSEDLCDKYLTRVFQYVNYWVDNTELAEELTLETFHKALIRYKSDYKHENTFSTGIFTVARNTIQDYIRKSGHKPILPELSYREQEVISLKVGAVLNNRSISEILRLPESNISLILCQSLSKMNGCL